MKERVAQIFAESIVVKEQTLKDNIDQIVQVTETVIAAFKNRNRVFFCGNGGSAADSQHIAAEFVGRFQKERQAWPAIALTTDTSALTALGNDYSFDIVFARQLQALGQKGDVVFGITTSGNSKNIIEAFKAAKSLGITTIAVTGGSGGAILPLADLVLKSSSNKTARIQESHLVMFHAICELVEAKLTA